MDWRGWILRQGGYVKAHLWGMGVQVPVLQIRIAGVCADNDDSGGGVRCPMDWVGPNGVLIGCAGRV